MAIRSDVTLLYAVVGIVCGVAHAETPVSAPTFKVHSVALPGAPASGVAMDYIAYDRAHHRVWVPAGNTGSVDVVDVKDDHVTRVEGFPTSEVERNGTKRTVGPSSATVGKGVVYVGSRGDSSVCAVDAASLTKGACLKLPSMPDGLAYVASTKEVWVTTPRDNSIAILDASTAGALSWKAKISLEGQPEGFAVDDGRGVFYTNFEDKDRTLTIDVKSRRVTRNWPSQCGADGPRGLAVDPHLNFLFVACTSRVMVLDAGHDGKQLSTMDVGEGIDNIDYVEVRKELFAAAGRAAKLVIAHVDAKGALTQVATVATAAGARNAVATDEGTAYVTDAPEGKILVVAAALGAAGALAATILNAAPPPGSSLAPGSRCFELRTYTAAPGKLEALHARFRDHTNALFTKHGMTLVGYWVPSDADKGAGNTLVYLLAFPDRAARDKAWKDFQSDPAWTATREASEVNGKLTEKIESLLLTATDYSPMK